MHARKLRILLSNSLASLDYSVELPASQVNAASVETDDGRERIQLVGAVEVIRSCLLDKKATELALGTPFGTPIPPRLTAASKNEKGLYDWSTFNIR